MGEARRRRLAAQKAGLEAPEYPEPLDGVLLRLEQVVKRAFYERLEAGHRLYLATLTAEREKGTPDVPAWDPDFQEFVLFGLVQNGLAVFEEHHRQVQAADKLIVTPAEFAAQQRR